MFWREDDLKQISIFIERDFADAVNSKQLSKNFPNGARWFASYQVNALIVSLIKTEDLLKANEFYKRFGTPFPGLIAPDFGDNVGINAYDGNYYYKDNTVKNKYAINILAGASVILENHHQIIHFKNSTNSNFIVDYTIPIGFVLGIAGHAEFESIKGTFKKLVNSYFHQQVDRS